MADPGVEVVAGWAAVHFFDEDDVLRRLVARQVLLDEGLQHIGVERLVDRYDGGDRFSEALVGATDHHAVAHALGALHDLFDFFGEDLLAAGVDAHRSAPQQQQGLPVLVHLRPVAGYRESAVRSVDERARALLRILVVADRLRSTDTDEPFRARLGVDHLQRFVE
jgi:hypothetical protein